VQKNLLANANDSHFAVPNTLISASNPWIPIANPTDQPHYIRKGEIIRLLEDPSEFFETPVTAERREVLTRHASAITDIIKTQLAGDKTTPNQDILMHSDPNEQEDYSPKTAAMPDSAVYPSSEMKDLIDVGSLPEQCTLPSPTDSMWTPYGKDHNLQFCIKSIWTPGGLQVDSSTCIITKKYQYFSLLHLFLLDSRTPVGILLKSYWIC